ncbi:MAG: segregation/condensation protein A [archaeon]|nr:segregation/condensation protein A [archaeon]
MENHNMDSDLEELESSPDSDSIIALPDSMDQAGLVDLIDQPAWKTILIELVKKERMDPWDIDIAHLAEMYLGKINALTSTDLRLPANAILASAILLKFKSNVLKLSDIDDEDEFLEKKKEMSPEEIAEFELLLPDLKSIRKIKEGKVSLDALVDSIEKMLQHSKKTQDKSFLRRERTKFEMPMSDFQIDKEMDAVYKLITKNADSEGLVLFSQLIKTKEGDVKNIVRTFLPCLFLTNKGKINMWQDEFFGEIFIATVKSDEKP